MSRGKRGTCNYKMYTFRISIKNLKYIEWFSKMNGLTRGQAINQIIDVDAGREKRLEELYEYMSNPERQEELRKYIEEKRPS